LQFERIFATFHRAKNGAAVANHLYDCLTRPARTHPDRTLFSDPQGPGITNSTFLDWTESLSATLVAAHVEPGDRVAILAHKGIAVVAAYLAILRVGAIIVPLNPASTEHELQYFLENSDPRVFVADDTTLAACMPFTRQRKGLGTLSLNPNGCGSLMQAAGNPGGRNTIRERRAEDIAALLYSSGTTGRPKGIMLSHGALVANAKTLVRIWEFSPADVLLHSLPIFHLHGLIVATHVALIAGCEIIFLRSFDPAKVINALARSTVMMGVPTYYRRLLNTPGLAQAELQQVRLFITGSAPLPPDLAREWRTRTGHTLLNRYGMTEANIIASNTPRNGMDVCSVGPPLPGVDVRIRDLATGDVLAGNQPGALEIRGPALFSGYWRMPEKTREAWHDDGFFRTGDLARLDADGSLHIEGRLQDLIISGGMNVYPAEVEAVINSHPDTADSVVIGVPHPDYGEGVLAVVLAREGASISIEALHNHVRGHLSGYKCPKSIVVRTSLPRNAMEKVDRNALRQTYQECFDP